MKRIFGIDLIRSIAVFMVLSVHFFLNTNFYNMNIKGFVAFISVLLRWLFYIGVPIFIIITGYLKKDKELNKEYYKGIKKILISYLLISILCIFFRYFYLNQKTRILYLLVSIFNFSADGYAWYIEMYIGLFLLIPFLNILYKGLETKSNKRKLIYTLIALVSIGPLINYIKIDGIKMEIIPNWWDKIYPILYYFLGCYIKDYGVKVDKIKGIILFIIVLLIQSILSYLYAYDNKFDNMFFGGYGSLTIVILSTLFFLLIYNIKCEKEKFKGIINKISVLSLNIYLFSFMTDNVIYRLFTINCNANTYLLYYIPTVFLSFVFSFILAYIAEKLLKIIKI